MEGRFGSRANASKISGFTTQPHSKSANLDAFALAQNGVHGHCVNVQIFDVCKNVDFIV